MSVLHRKMARKRLNSDPWEPLDAQWDVSKAYNHHLFQSHSCMA